MAQKAAAAKVKVELPSVEGALATLAMLAETPADEAKVKGIREWACRKTGTPFHEKISEVKS